MERGEIWWARCDLAIEDELWEDGQRPVLLLSAEEGAHFRTMMIVAPARTYIRGLGMEVAVGTEEGLSRPGVLRVALPQEGRILCDWLGQVARSDLARRAGILSSAKLHEVEDMLHLARLHPSRWRA